MRSRALLLLALAACTGHGAAAAKATTAASPPSLDSAPPPPPRTLTPAEIASHALPAIVTMRTEQSLGTGFVIRADGWIATNLHVIVGGPRVKVTLADRELDVVEVIAASPEHDLAVVRVEAHGLPVLALGDSDAMRPGDAVVAIGNPMGLENTVSNGLVSARRKFDAGVEVLQISAPIAPGSSGGPIFNDHGEVIGIATAVLEQGQNLNFGMPASYLVSMLRAPEPVPFPEFAKLIAQLRQAGARTARKHASYPASLLDGCSTDAQRLIVRMVSDAIDTGAPLYNAGKTSSSYHVYDGAAADLARRLPPACRGPARAIGDAQKHAAGLADPSAQAWAMREAFDALIEVVMRKQHL
jgi:serine protease Do